MRSADSTARASPVDAQDRQRQVGASAQTPSGASRSIVGPRVERAEDVLRRVEPEQDAGLLLEHRRAGPRARRDRRERRPVAVADVLGERAGDDVLAARCAWRRP